MLSDHITKTAADAAAKYRDDRCDMMKVAREMTVAELLDRHISKQTRLLNSLGELKNSLPASFLNSGASRIAGILDL